jgi:hypothetical protein
MTPEIVVKSVEDCGDAVRIHYTASHAGRSVECGVITTAHKSDELQRVLEREGAYHLRSYT